MNRSIVRFRLDEESDWVADLVCGHAQHVRHGPPFTNRRWVVTEEGRATRIGTDLDCVRCDRSELPEGFAPYSRTAEFNDATIPEALLGTHSTKRGVWALIHVLRGQLEYHVDAPFNQKRVLTSEAPGVVLPEVEHRVAPRGAVAFFVEFWRQPRVPR